MLCIKCAREITEDAVFCSWCGKKQSATKKTGSHKKRSCSAGSITKVSGNRARPYNAKLPADYSTGKPVRKSLGYFETYKAADIALREALTRGEVSEKRYTLKDIYEKFETSNYFQLLSKQGQASHEKAWKHLSMYENYDVTKMSKLEFQDAADIMQQKGLKRETIAKVRNLSSLLCKECMGMKLMTVNYGALVQLPKSDKEPKQPFTRQQLFDIWKEAEALDSAAMVVALMCYTGMRPSELLNVQIDKHIKSLGDMRYFVTGSKTEAGRNRIIPIPESVHPFLNHLIDGRGAGSLILSPANKTWALANWRKRAFAPLMEKLNIQGATPYTGRHTYADMQKRQNIDPEIMMEIMGHTDYSTTVENYHTTTDDDIFHILNAVNGLKRPELVIS